ncbi:hypothetical protein C8Q75DRAFT_758308 [Abortiporus biennis]|nr:hypothetical protein C8Q75DRAFT_758308 [Abortiporus biennis]
MLVRRLSVSSLLFIMLDHLLYTSWFGVAIALHSLAHAMTLSHRTGFHIMRTLSSCLKFARLHPGMLPIVELYHSRGFFCQPSFLVTHSQLVVTHCRSEPVCAYHRHHALSSTESFDFLFCSRTFR